MPSDWFRRLNWTPDVEADFFARLERARPQSRAQYLRIQAVHLRAAGGSVRLRKALDLVGRLLSDYPESTEMAAAQWCRGQCLADLGDLEGAILALRAALANERARPSVRTNAYLSLGMLIVRHRRADLYREALAALDEFGGSELLPQQQYEAAAIRAVALDARGARSEARRSALRALDAVGRKISGLRYHPRVGLAVIGDARLYADIQRISGGKPDV